jgi:hypothetical protein
MLPDYEKYMRELRRVRCRQRAQTLKTQKKGIKPLQLDLLGLPLGRVLRGQ